MYHVDGNTTNIVAVRNSRAVDVTLGCAGYHLLGKMMYGDDMRKWSVSGALDVRLRLGSSVRS